MDSQVTTGVPETGSPGRGARASAALRGGAYGLFWSWNLIFLAFMALGFAPTLLPEMIKAVRADQIPLDFLVYALVLTAIPAVAVGLGLTVLRREPGHLLALGYGIEGPLMLLIGLRFFIVRQLTPPLAWLLIVAGLGLLTLLAQLLERGDPARYAWLAYPRLIGLTLLFVTGLYVCAWIAFYILPVGVTCIAVVSTIGDTFTHLELRWAPLWFLGVVLAVYSGTLFVGLPLVAPILYGAAWRRGARAFVARHGRPQAAVLTLAVLAIVVGVFAYTNRQPQHHAFSLLDKTPTSPAEARALLKQAETIRTGLLNAYLSPQRYISAVGEVYHVRDMYRWSLGLSEEQAASVQRLYEWVARPLLYEPAGSPKLDAKLDGQALHDQPIEAARLYQTFFDRPIVQAERQQVVRAVRSTWSVDQAMAAWQAVDDREVHLVRQEVTLSPQGDWAEIELYEVYRNQTGMRQEVVYYFSLPESAVITGVWLGNSPERSERFAYRVSPRGAAQAVYRNEVRYNRDPALVEQIGPRQYRLRVFPVEPQTRRWDESKRSYVEEGPSLYMWLTARVLADQSAWPLPRLAEKRNVYWDANSVRLVNGQPVSGQTEAWLPDAIPAGGALPARAHRVDFPSGQTVIIRPASPADVPDLSGNWRWAVVLDRSRSMADYATEVTRAVERLAELAAAGAQVDVYLTASTYRGEPPSLVSLAELNPADILYYGGQNAAELLAQFETLRAGRLYDAVLVLTDGSGYGLGAGDTVVPIPDAPVWMVHLDGDFSLGYDDATLQAIQASGGGVAGDLDQALTRLAAQSTADIIDGYVWLTAQTAQIAAEAGGDGWVTHAPSDAFAAFAARRIILAEMQRQRGALGELGTLDQLHAIAFEHGIVTPYSSMIVLVEERQRQLLDQLEAEGDRFQREYEEVGETVPQNSWNVTGVPEPEEWLLLTLAAAMLAWYMYRRRAAGLIV